jgi:hypothetical protein
MKSIKLFLVIAAALAVCTSGALAHCGNCGSDKAKKEGKCDKSHKCCAEAKKAGKTCEKCAPKEEKKDAAK